MKRKKQSTSSQEQREPYTEEARYLGKRDDGSHLWRTPSNNMMVACDLAKNVSVKANALYLVTWLDYVVIKAKSIREKKKS